MGDMDRHPDRDRPTGRRRGAALVAACGLIALLASCVPAPAPGPEVRPQPADRGKVAGQAVAPSAGCASSERPPVGRSLITVETDQGHRQALLDMPADAGDPTPRPVLLSLHPFTLDANGWDTYSGLAAAAVARGYIVLTPFGSEPGPRWAVPGGLDTGVDDIGFLSAALDLIEDTACVDRNAEFSAGFSAGAAMSQALSCTLPWRMAAVAASGGSNLTDLCPASPGTSVMVLHGTADPIAPISGNVVVFAPPLGIPVDAVVATDAARAGCSPDPVTTELFPSVVVDRYVDCDADLAVEFWRLIGAGHTWAGADSPFDIITGPTNTAISANERILDFFDDQRI